MKNFSSYLLALALAVAATGCGKDDDPQPDPVSAKTKLLTTPKWRMTAVAGSSVLLGQTLTFDGFSRIPACKKDDFSKFSTDKSIVVDEGASRCATADPQSKKGTWSFNADETQLTVVDPSVPAGSAGHTVTADVVELTATQMQVKTTNTQVSNGITVVSTATTTYTAF